MSDLMIQILKNNKLSIIFVGNVQENDSYNYG